MSYVNSNEYSLKSGNQYLYSFSFLIAIIGLIFYLYSYPSIDVSNDLKTWSIAHILLHSLPVYLYLRHSSKKKTNFPFIETLAFFNIIHFGLPAFFIKTKDFQLGIFEVDALRIIFYGYLLFYLTYFYFQNNTIRKPIVFIPVNVNLFQIKYFAYTLFAIYLLHYFVGDSTVVHLGNIGFYVYAGFIIKFWKDRTLGAFEKLIFILSMISELVNRALGGFLAPLALLLFFISICLLLVKGSRLFIIAGAVFFIFFYSLFSGIKDSYRAQTWYQGKAQTTLEKIQLIEDLNEQNQKKSAFGYADTYRGKDHILWRYSYQMSAMSLVLQKTPDYVPFWNGESYLPLFAKFIPRLLWPNKPEENMGYRFGVTYNIISKANKRTSINTPVLAELYMNYGYYGVFIGCIFLGWLYSLFTFLFNSALVSYPNKIVGMAIIFPLVIWESNFSLIFGNLLLVTLALIYIFKVVKLFK